MKQCTVSASIVIGTFISGSRPGREHFAASARSRRERAEIKRENDPDEYYQIEDDDLPRTRARGRGTRASGGRRFDQEVQERAAAAAAGATSAQYKPRNPPPSARSSKCELLSISRCSIAVV